jgi:hypothetical protein
MILVIGNDVAATFGSLLGKLYLLLMRWWDPVDLLYLLGDGIGFSN